VIGGVDGRSLEAALATAAFVLTLMAAAVALWRTRSSTMVRDMGLLLLAFALAGPAAWPWYLIWGLVLVAACPGIQRWPLMVVAVVAAVFVVKPDGILALPLGSAPAVLAVYVVLAVGAWYSARPSGGDRVARDAEIAADPTHLSRELTEAAK
jgi:alpha-1,6-mannosyltransferase